jgi:hypothetical protein
MITENTKKIFSNAAKATEKFAREAISVFPKIDIEKTKLVDVSAKDIKIIKSFKFNKTQEGSSARDIIKMSGKKLNSTIKDKEIEGVIKGIIKKPTGIFKKDK